MRAFKLSRAGRIVSAIVIAATLASGLAACSSSTAPQAAGGLSADCKSLFALTPGNGPGVVIAADETASTATASSDPAVSAVITAASRHRGTLSVLAVQGANSKPDWVRQGVALNDATLPNDTNRFSRIVTMAPECASELAAEAAPHTAGSDILTAMQLGATQLGGSGTFILETDGMSNSGILDFAKQVYGSSPASIVKALEQNDQLPKFKGEVVRISGIGAVAGAPLNQTIVGWFVKVFQAICVASDAKSCSVTSAIAKDAAKRTGLPADAQLPLPTIPTPKVENGACVYVLSNSVLFGGQSAVLSPNADATLQAFVTKMAGNKAKVEIDGFTATFGTKATDLALSRARAKAVFDRLVSLGFDGSRLKWVGKGGSDPRVSPDHNGNVVIESAAAKNRRVELRVTGLSSCR